MGLVFVDTETTGLDLDRHPIWEIAWATESSLVESAFVAHDLTGADPKALALNGYFDRLPRPLDLKAGFEAEARMKEALTGSTLVAANPAFDAARLEKRWSGAVWKYRLLDVEAFAMPILGYDEPRGLKTIVEDLGSLGLEVFPSDHTAANDVQALRDAFFALWELRDLGAVPRGTFGGAVAR